jgi:hypothetical protein
LDWPHALLEPEKSVREVRTQGSVSLHPISNAAKVVCGVRSGAINGVIPGSGATWKFADKTENASWAEAIRVIERGFLIMGCLSRFLDHRSKVNVRSQGVVISLIFASCRLEYLFASISDLSRIRDSHRKASAYRLRGRG